MNPVDKLKIAQKPNINLNNRPKVQNKDGSYSTVYSIGIEADGNFINIPRVVGGRVVSEDEAKKEFRRSGKHLGIYKSQAERDKAAIDLHNSQAQMYDKRR